MGKQPDGLPADKRQRISRAALREFAQRGYALASTNAITAQAGISKGLLFHHFGNKAGLYLYLVEEHLASSVAYLRGLAAAQPPPGDMVERLMQSAYRKLEFAREQPEVAKFLFDALAAPPPELAAEIRQLAERYRPDVEAHLGREVDAGRLRPGVSVERAVKATMVFSEGLRALYATQLAADPAAAERLLAEARDYLDILRYGIYRPPDGSGAATTQ